MSDAQTALTGLMACKKHKFVVAYKAKDGSFKKNHILATDAYSAGEIVRKNGDVVRLYDVSVYEDV
jgi:hypothetical protein